MDKNVLKRCDHWNSILKSCCCVLSCGAIIILYRKTFLKTMFFDESSSVTIEMKDTEQWFPTVLPEFPGSVAEVGGGREKVMGRLFLIPRSYSDPLKCPSKWRIT